MISGLVKMVSLVKPFKFVTNNRVERSGFSAQFKEIDEFQSACGGKAAVIAEFNSEYPKRPSALSHISSAGFPGRVPPGSECSWHITAPANNQIVHLEFISFKMAKNCKFHFVQLYSAPDCKPENLKVFFLKKKFICVLTPSLNAKLVDLAWKNTYHIPFLQFSC